MVVVADVELINKKFDEFAAINPNARAGRTHYVGMDSEGRCVQLKIAIYGPLVDGALTWLGNFADEFSNKYEVEAIPKDGYVTIVIKG